jgi:acyl dehydratase
MSETTIRELRQLPSPLALYGGALLTARKPARVGPLPELCLRRPAVKLDAAHIARYAALCGFTPAHGVPPTYPHMLAFPLHMRLMADARFPYSMMGMVHLANILRQHAQLSAEETLSIDVRAGRPQAHEKGQAFSLLTEARQDGQLVWESESIYLRTGIRTPQGPACTSQIEETPARVPEQTWAVDASIGRRYGALSGDLNPIHLSRLTALAFGFPRAIAHGMWTKARALAAVLPATPVMQGTAHVEFKTPLFLPGQATFWQSARGTVQHFEVRDGRGEKPHLRGLWWNDTSGAPSA